MLTKISDDCFLDLKQIAYLIDRPEHNAVYIALLNRDGLTLVKKSMADIIKLMEKTNA